MTRLSVVPSTLQHAARLEKTLRAADRIEGKRLGIPASDGVMMSYRRSLMRYSAFWDGEMAAMWGVVGTPLTPVGQPWLLTSDVCDSIPPAKFAAVYRAQVKDMQQLFPMLINFVDAEYTSAIRLLRLAGFSVRPPEPHGIDGALFCRFEMMT